MLHSHKNVDNDETADAHEKKRAKNRSEIGEELRKHRFNLEQILRNSNITPIRCHRGYGYVCCFCAKEFPQPADLKTHTLQVHSEKEKARLLDGFLYKFHAKLDITGLECSICANTIDTLEEFINHLHKIHDIKMHMDIKNQLFPFKFDNDELKCCICHNKYQKFKSLLEHMNVHYRNFICPDCNAGFINRSILAEHSKKHMLGVFACGICSKVFDTLRKKQSHEKFVHDDKKLPNKCGHCGEKFKDYRKKEEHLVSVHGVVHKRPECEACSRSFKNQKDYNLHIRRLHLMDKRHKCPNCDMAFFTTGELKSHVVKHTGAKGFQCAVCHKSYGRRKTLIEHMRIHNNDKRFKCERCGVAFVQKCRWRGHMWTKHEEHV
ncbi:unnamed protein product [Leptosia nina]|uniref:C2H2-type domain-containing protein n=1 Tax=Leptosia nina TaxID=320188 RepID=A0AAV1K103_9NEOP